MEDESSSSDSENNKSKSRTSSEKDNNSENSQKSEIEQEEITNYYSYIDECSTSIEESRQNYINNLEDLKSKTNELKSKNLKKNEYAITILEEYIKICDDYYSIFSKAKEILSKFNDLNDIAQDMQFSYQKSNNSASYFKEMYQKINKEIIKKIEENEQLRKKIKEMNSIKKENENFINLNKQKNENKIMEKSENNKSNIEIKNKMDNLMEENKELKRKYSQIVTESQLFKDFVDQKYILKQESTKRMSCLLEKIDLYENKIDKLQNKINEIENAKIEKSEIVNDEKENIINLENPKSYISDNSSIKDGINLEDLLDNNPEEVEENQEEEIKNIKEEKSNNSNNPPYYNEYDMDINKNSIINLCPISKQYKKQKLNNIKIYKSPVSYSSSQTNSIINMGKKKNAKSVYTSKIKKKDLKNSYRIFFFLLLRSIIINYEILQNFQKSDFQNLFEECEKEKIPFNQYYNWIIKRININENDKNKYEDEPSIIDGFICTTLI